MKIQRIAILSIALFLFTPIAGSFAGEAEVVNVKAEGGKNGTWTFSVTVRHADEGWDHYADKWDVMDLEGNILGTRVLYHPHVGEQPFTRSLGGIEVPESVGSVLVRAHDSVHGFGGKEIEVKLKE